MACLSWREQEHEAFAAHGTFAEPGVDANYPPSRTCRIVNAALELTIDPVGRRFQGTLRLHLVPTPLFAGTWSLDAEEITVVSAIDDKGVPLTWLPTDQGLLFQCEVPTWVELKWTGENPTRGMYFTGPTAIAPNRQHMAWTQCQDEDSHFVFPCHDHPGARHPWTVTVIGPVGYTVLSNGRRVSEEIVGEHIVGRFAPDAPMPAYLVTAVVARLTALEHEWKHVPVRYLVPVGEEENALRGMGRTPEMMELFSTLTGVAYPWARYDQVVVHDFVFGGMENTGCTTMTDMLLVDEKGASEWEPDGLVAHELAHQWFGDLVTCQDWSQGWLNESWATVMEAVWWKHSRPEGEATWYRWQMANGYFDEHSRRYRRPIVSYRFREPIDLFDRHLYNKGGMVLWTLLQTLGDKAFWGGVSAYLHTNRDGTVHTRQFQHSLEQHTGANLDRFFDQWIFGAGHPSVDVSLGEEPGLVLVTVAQKQKGADVAAAFHFNLDIEIVLEDGTRTAVSLPITETKRTFALPRTGPVRTVRIDAGFRVLAEIVLTGPVAWLIAATEDPCPVLALRACVALLRTDKRKGVEAVWDTRSGHPCAQLRSSLAERLGARRGDDTRDRLIEALCTDTSPIARRGVAVALGEFRDSVCADALMDALTKNPETWQLHAALLTSLGSTRDERAIPVLRNHLTHESWADTVKRGALAGLGAGGWAVVLTDLVKESQPDRQDRSRGAAATALARLAEQQEPLRRVIVDRLIEMLSEPGFRAQLGSIDALGQLRDARAERALVLLHCTAPDGRTRRMAFEAVARIQRGANEGLTPIRSRMDDIGAEVAKLRQRVDRLDGPS